MSTPARTRETINFAWASMSVAGEQVLAITLSKEGFVSRKGDGTTAGDPLYQGWISPQLFERLMEQVTDDLLTRRGRYEHPDRPGQELVLALALADSSDDVKRREDAPILEFVTGTENLGFPADVGAVVTEMIELTDPWWKEQKASAGRSAATASSQKPRRWWRGRRGGDDSGGAGDVDSMAIAMMAGERQLLFVFLARDGSINRMGDATLEADRELCIGMTPDPLFDRLMEVVPDDLFQRAGSHTFPGEKRDERKLTLIFSKAAGRPELAETKAFFEYIYDSQNDVLPEDIALIVQRATELTDPFWRETLEQGRNAGPT